MDKLNLKSKGKKLLKSKKFKYGSSAVVFTAIFIVFVLLINVVLSVIDAKFGGLYIDMTSKKIYNITDASRQALKDVTLPVEIIFCRPSDIIESSEHMNAVQRLADNYASEFSNISVKYRDKISDPTYFNQFMTTSSDVISDSSVIVSCPSNGAFVVSSLNSFYKFNTEGKLFAFDGENKLTTSILRTARPQALKAAFTKGHNESVSGELIYLLTEQGYEVSQVDLKTVSREELNSYDLVVICNPTIDFTGLVAEKEGQVNEIGLLNSYLTGSFGNLFVFLSPETPELPELKEFLSEDWGVDYTPGKIISESSQHAVSPDGYAILGQYSDSKGSAGYEIHRTISQGAAGARALFDYAVPLKFTFDENNYKTTSAVALTSSSSSVTAGSLSEKAPSIPLMTITDYARSYDDGEKHAYVLVSASSYFLNYIPTNMAVSGASQYANADIIKSTLKLTGNTNIAANIDFKVLDESDIQLTSAQSRSFMQRLGIIVPVIISVIGTVVFVKRKYL